MITQTIHLTKQHVQKINDILLLVLDLQPSGTFVELQVTDNHLQLTIPHEFRGVKGEFTTTIY